MPRGRKLGSKNKKTEAMLNIISDAVGPALEKAVAEEKKEIKKHKEPQKYIKIKLQNITDPGDPASFTFDGKSYTLLENIEATIPMKVYNHLSSIKEKRLVFCNDPSDPSKRIRKIQERSRFFLERTSSEFLKEG